MDFEATLNGYLSEIETALRSDFSDCDCRQKTVFDAMQYAVTDGGKRIRPILVLEFCNICGGDPARAIPFAEAVEAIHSYSLVHDDLPCMDNDDFRRGKPACHKAFGEANALLAGDGLLTRAFGLLAKADLPPERIIRGVEILSHQAGASGMIGGQVIDLESEGKQVDGETVSAISDLKTAALLRAACMLGAVAAGADEEQIRAAETYGTALGHAFQIVDDLLDVTGDAAVLGKPIGSDAANQKSTYLSLYGMDAAVAAANAYTQTALDALRPFAKRAFLEQLTMMLVNRDR